MYKDVQNIINIINKSKKNTIKAYEKMGANWRVPAQILDQTKQEILDEYELYECYHCEKVFDRSDAKQSGDNKFCSTDCKQKEYLEVI